MTWPSGVRMNACSALPYACASNCSSCEGTRERTRATWPYLLISTMTSTCSFFFGKISFGCSCWTLMRAGPVALGAGLSADATALAARSAATLRAGIRMLVPREGGERCTAGCASDDHLKGRAPLAQVARTLIGPGTPAVAAAGRGRVSPRTFVTHGVFVPASSDEHLG